MASTIKKLLEWSLQLLELLGPYLFDLGLPDLVRHPGRRSFGLIDLYPLSLEDVHFFGSSLPELDIGVTSIGGLQSSLAG